MDEFEAGNMRCPLGDLKTTLTAALASYLPQVQIDLAFHSLWSFAMQQLETWKAKPTHTRRQGEGGASEKVLVRSARILSGSGPQPLIPSSLSHDPQNRNPTPCTRSELLLRATGSETDVDKLVKNIQLDAAFFYKFQVAFPTEKSSVVVSLDIFDDSLPERKCTVLGLVSMIPTRPFLAFLRSECNTRTVFDSGSASAPLTHHYRRRGAHRGRSRINKPHNISRTRRTISARAATASRPASWTCTSSRRTSPKARAPPPTFNPQFHNIVYAMCSRNGVSPLCDGEFPLGEHPSPKSSQFASAPLDSTCSKRGIPTLLLISPRSSTNAVCPPFVQRRCA